MVKVFKWIFAGIAVIFIAGVLSLNIFFPLKHTDTVHKNAREFGVDPGLVFAVIWTESKFDSDAVSPAGARGLMQLMPATAHWCAGQLDEKYSDEKLSDPEFNIRLGVYYLSYLTNKYGGDALAAYNAGEGNFIKYSGEVPYKETRDYVRRVRFARTIYRLKLGL